MDKHEFDGTVRSPGCGLGRVLVYHDETFGLVPSKKKEGSEQMLPLHKKHTKLLSL